MSRLSHAVLNLAAALSAAVLAATVVLWVRGYHTADEVSLGRFRVFSLVSRNGTLHAVLDSRWDGGYGFFGDCSYALPFIPAGEVRPPAVARCLTPEDGRCHLDGAPTSRSPAVWPDWESSWWFAVTDWAWRWDCAVPDRWVAAAAAILPALWVVSRPPRCRRLLARMAIPAFHVAALASAVACVAIVALWVRSYRTADAVGWQQQLETLLPVQDSSSPGSVADVAAQTPLTIIMPCDGQFRGILSAGGSLWIGHGTAIDERTGFHHYEAMPAGPNLRRLPLSESLGFRITMKLPNTDHMERGWYDGLVVPYWFPFALTAALPAVWLAAAGVWGARRWRRAARARRGLCRQCGYDLTGNSSGRCSECGELVATGRRMTA